MQMLFDKKININVYEKAYNNALCTTSIKNYN